MVDVRGLPASRTDNEDLSSIYKIRGKNGGFTSSPGRRSYGLLKQSICNPVFARSTLLISSFTDMPQMNVTGQGSPYPLPRHAFLYRHLAAAECCIGLLKPSIYLNLTLQLSRQRSLDSTEISQLALHHSHGYSQ